MWTWSAVFSSVLVAVLISPYVIRKIGVVNFGAWTLALSLVEYCWLLDFGLRSAAVKMSAEYRALERQDKLEELFSTGATYAAIVGVFIVIVTLFTAPHLGHLFRIATPAFPLLVTVVGVSWAVGLVFNVLGACAEGFQRFDLYSRILILINVVRSLGIVLVLRAGHGILQMGLVLLASQMLQYALLYAVFRQVAHGVNLSWRKSSRSMFSEMSRYGVHTFTATVATRLLGQSVPLLIAYFLPSQFLTYYVVPAKILDYAMDGVGRVGQVTTPNASELLARGKTQGVVELAVYSNRYCLALFTPLTAFLLVYGFELYSLWISPEVARQSAYLLPVLLIGYTAVAGQFNSSSVLFGIGRHKWYARLLMVEALLVLAGLILVLPRFGLYGLAWVISTGMLLNRGVAVCVLTARELGVSAVRYAMRICGAPLANGAAAVALLFWLKAHSLPGRTWFELTLAGFCMAALYGALSFRFCLEPAHRDLIWRKLKSLAG
jgi:O-antigen/teichoic acid export membrane protein